MPTQPVFSSRKSYLGACSPSAANVSSAPAAIPHVPSPTRSVVMATSSALRSTANLTDDLLDLARVELAERRLVDHDGRRQAAAAEARHRLQGEVSIGRRLAALHLQHVLE